MRRATPVSTWIFCFYRVGGDRIASLRSSTAYETRVCLGSRELSTSAADREQSCVAVNGPPRSGRLSHDDELGVSSDAHETARHGDVPPLTFGLHFGTGCNALPCWQTSSGTAPTNRKGPSPRPRS
jgi:hypothetical protein